MVYFIQQIKLGLSENLFESTQRWKRTDYEAEVPKASDQNLLKNNAEKNNETAQEEKLTKQKVFFDSQTKISQSQDDTTRHSLLIAPSEKLLNVQQSIIDPKETLNNPSRNAIIIKKINSQKRKVDSSSSTRLMTKKMKPSIIITPLQPPPFKEISNNIHTNQAIIKVPQDNQLKNNGSKKTENVKAAVTKKLIQMRSEQPNTENYKSKVQIEDQKSKAQEVPNNPKALRTTITICKEQEISNEVKQIKEPKKIKEHEGVKVIKSNIQEPFEFSEDILIGPKVSEVLKNPNSTKNKSKNKKNKNNRIQVIGRNQKTLTIPRRITNGPKYSNGWSWEGEPEYKSIHITVNF